MLSLSLPVYYPQKGGLKSQGLDIAITAKWVQRIARERGIVSLQAITDIYCPKSQRSEQEQKRGFFSSLRLSCSKRLGLTCKATVYGSMDGRSRVPNPISESIFGFCHGAGGMGPTSLLKKIRRSKKKKTSQISVILAALMPKVFAINLVYVMLIYSHLIAERNSRMSYFYSLNILR